MGDSPEEVPEVDESNTPDVIVVGGGIAGLTAALAARERGATVRLLDAHDLGGRARTTDQDGWLHNTGPHALYRAGRLAAVLDHHGLDLPGGIVGGRVIHYLRDDELHEVHVTPLGLTRASIVRPRQRVRLLTLFARLPRLSADRFAGTTVSDWLGQEPDDVRDVVESFVRLSSYTDAADTFDAGAAIAQLQVSLRGVRYLDGGWQRMIGALAGRARHLGVEVVEHADVGSVVPDGSRVAVTVVDRTLGPRVVHAGSVVVAAGGPDLAARLTGARVGDADALTAPIRATSLDLATHRPHDRFVLGLDRPLYLSPHAPVARLAPDGCGLVSAMRYLAPGDPAPDPGLARDELRALARHAGVDVGDDGDVAHERFLLQSVVAHGAPLASGGGLRGRPSIDALGLSGVLVAGDWVGPEGLLADASAASGVEAGAAAARHCASISA